MKRAVIIVLDSAGVGFLPDARLFGDEGADTIGHIIRSGGLYTPQLDRLGLRSIDGVSFYREQASALGCYGKAAERTLAKDTISGHWEMAGYLMDKPFRTYPQGFPPEIIAAFTAQIGRGVLGNCVASGTEIIERLGAQSLETGQPIVYTSADSVLQIAAHEQAIPVEQLYAYCETARALLVGEYAVGRVIARPFTGRPGGFQRTSRRRDYAVSPARDTILDALVSVGREVVAIGKIEDIFCRRGVTRVDHTTDNRQGIDATLRFLRQQSDGLIFTNLVDFDMLYGHRNDRDGYAAALEYFDSRLPELLEAMTGEDLLIITADHGCDPCFPGTDHTREYVPILLYHKGLPMNRNLGVRESFADIGATVYQYLGLGGWSCGRSLLE